VLVEQVQDVGVDDVVGVAVPGGVAHVREQVKLRAGIISAISRPSCGGACTSSVKAITCMGTRTDGSWARWS
jgi:hypothetical protein